jgi:hypothetical protein
LFNFGLDFELFRFRVANEFGVSAHLQKLVYRTNRGPKSNKTWKQLSEEADFEALVDQASLILQKEVEKSNSIVARNKEDAKKAKKKGRNFVPKPVPEISDYIVTVRDLDYQPETKKSTKKVSWLWCSYIVNILQISLTNKQKGKEEATAGSFAGIATKIIEYEKAIKEKKCDREDCEGACILVPVQGRPPEHKVLAPGLINLWAQLAVCAGSLSVSHQSIPDLFDKAKGSATLASPPPQVTMKLCDREKRGKGSDKGEKGKNVETLCLSVQWLFLM